MELTFEWTSIFNVAGVINGLFLTTVILGIKKGNKLTRILLAILIVNLILVIISSVLFTTNIYFFQPNLIGIFPQFYLLLGPLLLYYVKSLTDQNFKIKKRSILHTMPFLLSVIGSIPFYIKSIEYKINILQLFINSEGVQSFFTYGTWFRFFHICFYLILTAVVIRNHHSYLKDSYSSIEKMKLEWLRNLVVAFSLVWIANIVDLVLRSMGTDFTLKLESIFNIRESLLLFFIGYRGLIQSEVFSNQKQINYSDKYKNSTLTSKLADKHLKSLHIYVEKEKPYLKWNLSLKDLSDQLNISHRVLSQILNEKLHQNFYDFVNRFRVEEAKRCLKEDPPEKSILSIAYDVGFNAKSTFNTVFKKYVKMTPSQYRKSYNKSF
jgi:AraC-like DNA-binding protein